jgi:hypothetical protein
VEKRNLTIGGGGESFRLRWYLMGVVRYQLMKKVSTWERICVGDSL